MQVENKSVPLPLRSHTILGVCEAIGEDFGFNPVLLRVPFAATVLLSPELAVLAYLVLGLVVLLSRLLFPKAKSSAAGVEVVGSPATPNAANSSEPELPLAA
jgi:phage shock protein PspC (stress-responsive transcriptional regulator)